MPKARTRTEAARMSPRLTALLLGGAYVILGTAWVFFASAVLPRLAKVDPYAAQAPSWQGWAFVMLGGIFLASVLFLLLSRRQRAQEELERALQRYERLFRGSQDAILNLEDGRVAQANPRALELLGTTQDAARGRTLEELCPGGQRLPPLSPAVPESPAEGTSTPSPRVFRWEIARGGAPLPLEATLSRAVHQGRVLEQLILREAVGRDAARDAVRETERRLTMAVDQADAVVYCKNFKTNRYDFMGENVARLTGYPAAEMTPETWGNLVQKIVFPEELAGLPLGEPNRLYETGKLPRWSCEILIRTKSGELRWFRDISSPLVDADGKPCASVGMLQEISQRHAMEEKLRQSLKVEALGRVTSGIAHDFNNLLTIIEGYTAILQNRWDREHPQRLMLDMIQQAVERSANLTRQLLLFSRRHPGRLQPIHLPTVVSEAGPIVGRLLGPEIRLSQDHQPHTGRVLADPSLIHHLLINLVSNARDAMPDGGQVALSTGEVTHEGLLSDGLGIVPPGHYVRLRVSDSGAGMTPEVQARLFEPLFTTKGTSGRTGLGLSTVHSIVRQLHGFVTVESAPGSGTTFTLLFPRLADPSPGAVAAKP